MQSKDGALSIGVSVAELVFRYSIHIMFVMLEWNE